MMEQKKDHTIGLATHLIDKDHLINCIDVGIVFLDKNLNVILFTPISKKIYRFNPDYTGRPLAEIESYVQDADVISDARRVLASLEAIEKEVQTKDGSVFRMRVQPYRPTTDVTEGAILTFHEITRIKRAENELIQSVENLKLVMDSINDFAIIIMDADRIITEWNRGAESIFRFNAYEAIGQSADIIFTPEDRAAGMPQKEEQKAIERGSAEDERWHIRKDGSRFYASGVLTKLKEPSKGFVKIARDMTLHKIQEEQKDEFIAIASHELRTPVTSIKSYTELLLENMKADDNDENVRMVNKLNAQVDKLTDLVRALLDTTKITGKQMVLNKEAFDINEMVRSCVETFQRMTRKHQIILDQTKVPHLYADPEGINQVLNNIVSNAIKYSPSGGDIVVSTRLGGDNILIAVQDSGIGIPLDHQKLLFERFYRSPGQDKNTYPGLGLGMYISSEIVKRHGGNIRVESKEGEGSTFTVILPLVNTEDGQKENSQI